MTLLLKTVSALGLAITVASPVLAWTTTIPAESNKTALVVGMLLWFGTAGFWIKPDKTDG